MGTWKHTAGEWHGDKEDKGIQTSEDARFYGLSAPLEKTFTSQPGKDLVIQYSVKHEQNLDCGGAYLKLLPGGKKFDAAKFGGETPYSVMFGPDVCGASNKKTHVILHSNPKDENLLIKKQVMCETDDLTHLYTLVVHPDNTFEVFVDNKSVRQGKLEDEFDFMAPKEIKDPDVAYDVIAKENTRWTLLADFNQPNNTGPGYVFGMEFGFPQMGGSNFNGSVRASYSYASANSGQDVSGSQLNEEQSYRVPAVGGGLSYTTETFNLGFDYAWKYMGILGSTNFFTFSIGW